MQYLQQEREYHIAIKFFCHFTFLKQGRAETRMAKILNLATLFVTLAISATLFGHTTATTYTVGDSLGWTYPPNTTTYATWASQHAFVVGDVLVFNFTKGFHSVATVTKESFDACNVNKTISSIFDGPASITLNSTGEAYFFCTYKTHCSFGGQKLAISVTASTSSPPSSPPSQEPTPSTPQPMTPPPATSPSAPGPGGPAPTGSVIPPTPATSPPTISPSGPTPAGPVIAPSPPTKKTAPGPGGPAPTGLVIPQSPPPGSQPPSSEGDVPPTSPPSGAARTGLAGIFIIFISAAVYLFF